MKNVYLLRDAIISPIGFNTRENLLSLRQGISGLKLHKEPQQTPSEYTAGIIEDKLLNENFREIGDPDSYTKLEKMMILAVAGILSEKEALDLDQTGLIISSTKGNIDLLGYESGFDKKRVLLSELGKQIKEFFGFKLEPVIVSNACISGGLALSVAKRLMNAGKFQNAVVVAGDLVSEFVLSGFNSFQALSEGACKPFSKDRNGISLGEAAAGVLLSEKAAENKANVALVAEASANDANHISGPSRTGEGLFKSIQNAFRYSGVKPGQIDYLSAHGTATPYNDEMEAVAFNRCGLEKTPVNSLKGYYGHTLGASALIESIVCKHSLLNGELYQSLNFTASGVSKPLNIIQNYRNQNLEYALKTASGFGGSNLALILKKENNG
ncbi:beta-ketoacyl synthase N-terminal-like domain-containing protein [Salegentibacter chungangensis]|uniref:Beta-ketoacyl synthase N-terminal-like domain-containing protein n=1 Tax=Salegentibacter chungangensis TaxID=1335724 RepID=A0ABW3NT48_9FLAO